MTKNCEKSQLTRKIVRLAIFRNFRTSLSKNRQPSDFYNFSLTPENRNFCSCVKILDISVLTLTFVNGFTIFLCAERYLSKYKMASPNLVLRVRKGRDRASPSWATTHPYNQPLTYKNLDAGQIFSRCGRKFDRCLNFCTLKVRLHFGVPNFWTARCLNFSFG